MRVCEVNFGGEIGTRPAVILHSLGDKVEVAKITSKAKLSDVAKVKLSGYSGVRGYVVTNCLYTVNKNKIKRYTNQLFDFEAKEVYKKINTFNRQGKSTRIEL